MMPRCQDWADIIRRLRLQPGRWVLSVPSSLVGLESTVRLRRAASLHHHDGRLEAALQNVHEDEVGIKRGDLYLRWVPKATNSTYQ